MIDVVRRKIQARIDDPPYSGDDEFLLGLKEAYTDSLEIIDLYYEEPDMKYRGIIENLQNDIDSMMLTTHPSREEMWWNLALSVVLRRIKQYMEE